MIANRQKSPQISILEMTSGFGVLQALYTVIKLEIAEGVIDAPKHYQDIAKASKTDPELLYRLLRFLSSIEFFCEPQPGYFQIDFLGKCLLPNHPNSLRNSLLIRAEQEYLCWGKLLDTVQTGQSAFEQTFGLDRFEYFALNPEVGEVFDRSMVEISALHNQAILESYDFARFETVVDIGGGYGIFLSAILQQYSTLKGILFDLPHTIAKAPAYLDQKNVLKRCKLIPGSIFESMPPQGDIYILKHMLHMMNDQKSVEILKNCRQALSKNQRLLVIETVIADNTSWRAKFKDMNMLMVLSGKERTETEFHDLFKAAGFKLVNIIPTKSLLSIIEVEVNS